MVFVRIVWLNQTKLPIKLEFHSKERNIVITKTVFFSLELPVDKRFFFLYDCIVQTILPYIMVKLMEEWE